MEAALTSLHTYGIELGPHDSDIGTLLLRYAPTRPLRVYSAAAAQGLDAVCVAASQYTLPYSLDTLSEADALTMGAVYLRRLFFLHQGRREALIRVIHDPPATHQPTTTCSMRNQEPVRSTWELATAEVMLAPLPHNTSPEMLIEGFGGLILRPSCELCRDQVRKRVSDVIKAWLAVKRTI